MKYNYLEAVKADLFEVVADSEYYLAGMNKDDVTEWLQENAWTNDSVTGNASGSYTFNRWTAKEYVLDNLELLFNALDDFGIEVKEVGQMFKSQEWEKMDCIIRLYIVGQAVYEVVEQMEADGYFDSQEEGEDAETAAAAGC